MSASSGGPILSLQRERLGEERFERFVTGHANLQAMALFLVMSVNLVPQTGYSDEAIDALVVDARDVADAARAWSEDCYALAERWRAQREEGEG